MSQRNRETLKFKCTGCGHEFEVGPGSQDQLAISDRPVSGTPGGNMEAQGLVTVVVAKGPDNLPTEPAELPAYACPQCGHLN